mmetsp:Transcript_83599/g.190782  ORF Transcript_83599/g.190782 Transcript_83599/m.190782 type:complete len:200 (-) Transcript_83599:9-608(-)
MLPLHRIFVQVILIRRGDGHARVPSGRPSMLTPQPHHVLLSLVIVVQLCETHTRFRLLNFLQKPCVFTVDTIGLLSTTRLVQGRGTLHRGRRHWPRPSRIDVHKFLEHPHILLVDLIKTFFLLEIFAVVLTHGGQLLCLKIVPLSDYPVSSRLHLLLVPLHLLIDHKFSPGIRATSSHGYHSTFGNGSRAQLEPKWLRG